MKSVIITGATSMMGCALIRSLLAHSVERIYAVVQPNSRNINRISKDERIQMVKCFSEDYEKLSTLIDDNCDIFYHLAWIPSKREGRERYLDVNVATQNIKQSLDALNSASRLGCKVFIGAGSQAEYGKEREPLQSPNDLPNPVSAYAIAKDCVRRLVMIRAKELKMRVQWVRIFSVYGPHDRKNTMISMVLPKLLRNEAVELTKCNQIWDYLHEYDAGEGLYYAGLAEGNNIFCLGSGSARPLREYIMEMKELSKSCSKLLFGAIPQSDNEVMVLHANIESLKTNTGWPGPRVSFEEGIRNLIDVIK